jgi:hypothetical protein
LTGNCSTDGLKSPGGIRVQPHSGSAHLAGGDRLITEALTGAEPLTVPALANRFGVADLPTLRQDRAFMASLLYYFGVLTLAGRDVYRELLLRIPNLVVRRLYLERLQVLLLPEPEAQQEGRRAAQLLQRGGDSQPLASSSSSVTSRSSPIATISRQMN